MRHLGAYILLLGLAVPAVAADAPEPPKEEQSIPWYRWLFLGERAKPTPPPAPVVKVAPPSREALMKMLANESDVYVKRLEAISKIKLLADERGDTVMLKKAEEMERQAEEIFQQRATKIREMGLDDDRKNLERSTDDRPATAERPVRRPTRGNQ
jgi:hypothetical protein